MSLPNSPSIATFNGNGIAVDFPFTFKVWSPQELQVTLIHPEGFSMPATFTASLTDSGGSVRVLHEGKPLPAGWKLSIIRNMPFEQQVDLVSGTRFDPQVIEDALDKATAERQQLRESLARAVIVPPGSEDTPTDIVDKIFAARDTAVSSAAGAEQSATDAAEFLDKTIAEHAEALAEIDAHGKVQQDLCAEQVRAATEQAVHSAASAQSAAESARKAAEIADKGQPTATEDIQGITKLSDSTRSASGVDGGISATPKAVSDVRVLVDAAQSSADAALQKAATSVLSGSIIAFSGTFGGPQNRHPIPRGETEPDLTYILCDGGSDGKGGTVPDLRGRVLLGADESHPAGSIGGALEHTHSFTGTVGETTLTVAQIASHPHSVTACSNNGNNDAAPFGRGWTWNQETQSTNANGGSQPHTHPLAASSDAASSLPPYYALAYVIRIT